MGDEVMLRAHLRCISDRHAHDTHEAMAQLQNGRGGRCTTAIDRLRHDKSVFINDCRKAYFPHRNPNVLSANCRVRNRKIARPQNRRVTKSRNTEGAEQQNRESSQLQRCGSTKSIKAQAAEETISIAMLKSFVVPFFRQRISQNRHRLFVTNVTKDRQRHSPVILSNVLPVLFRHFPLNRHCHAETYEKIHFLRFFEMNTYSQMMNIYFLLVQKDGIRINAYRAWQKGFNQKSIIIDKLIFRQFANVNVGFGAGKFEQFFRCQFDGAV